MQYTNEASTPCQKKAIFAIDVLDTKRELLIERIPVTENLAQCDCGRNKCGYLEKWINYERARSGKAPLAKGTIKPTTTIAEVVGHVC